MYKWLIETPKFHSEFSQIVAKKYCSMPKFGFGTIIGDALICTLLNLALVPIIGFGTRGKRGNREKNN